MLARPLLCVGAHVPMYDTRAPRSATVRVCLAHLATGLSAQDGSEVDTLMQDALKTRQVGPSWGLPWCRGVRCQSGSSRVVMATLAKRAAPRAPRASKFVPQMGSAGRKNKGWLS